LNILVILENSKNKSWP